MASPTTLISVNVPAQTLSSFDRLCSMVGKSRTAVIIDLMREFVLADSRKIIEEVKRIARLSNIGGNASKIVSERRSKAPTSNQAFERSSASMKRFQEFLPGTPSGKDRG